ncbi:MAG: toll/interleukin-1 receptor domain-containing protein [Kineosporiaceae bacterium]|nr:toll/interleukin-1 receptor domain-containing protein [Kineosporiaceae bacterium]
MARVFISYRREDTPVVAARLATRLKDDLRLDNVFLDRMDILAGWPWRAVLARRLRSSDAVLVLVGDRWGGGPDGGRILAPHDMVR